MTLDEIEFRRAGEGVAEIVLNRPETLNAISGRPGGMRDQLLHALGLAERDGEIGCVVLRGAGRAFSGGGDITGNERRDLPADHERFLRTADEFHERVRTSEVPIIASVHGYCLGAGLTLAAACDVVIAGDGARFGFPEGRIGLAGATAVVPVVGRQWAKFLMISGELVTASPSTRTRPRAIGRAGRGTGGADPRPGHPGRPDATRGGAPQPAGPSTPRRMPPVMPPLDSPPSPPTP